MMMAAAVAEGCAEPVGGQDTPQTEMKASDGCSILWRPIAFIREGVVALDQCLRRPHRRQRDQERGVRHHMRMRGLRAEAPPFVPEGGETNEGLVSEDHQAPTPALLEEPASIYQDLERTYALARLENPANLRTAVQLVLREQHPQGHHICFRDTTFQMQMALAGNGLPTSPERLRELVEMAAQRRGISLDWEREYREVVVALGRRTFDYQRSFDSQGGYRVVRY